MLPEANHLPAGDGLPSRCPVMDALVSHAAHRRSLKRSPSERNHRVPSTWATASLPVKSFVHKASVATWLMSRLPKTSGLVPSGPNPPVRPGREHSVLCHLQLIWLLLLRWNFFGHLKEAEVLRARSFSFAMAFHVNMLRRKMLLEWRPVKHYYSILDVRGVIQDCPKYELFQDSVQTNIQIRLQKMQIRLQNA